MGLVIVSLLVIEKQMEAILTLTGTKYLNLSRVAEEDLAETIARETPSILLSNPETLAKEDVKAALLSVHLVYVAFDEGQVNFGNL